MSYHRALFDDEQWLPVQEESLQPLNAHRVVELGRRLLESGYLPMSYNPEEAKRSANCCASSPPRA